MSSLFHRRPSAQVSANQLASQQTGSQPAFQPGLQATAAPSLGSAVNLRQQGREAAHRLKLPYRHLLIEIAATNLDGSYEPYVPASAEIARLAATLADPSIGLLLAGSAGFVTCYSLTPLGGAVVLALLHDLLAQQVTSLPPAPWQGGAYEQW